MSMEGYSVLVVEDEEAVQMLLCKALEEKGYTVYRAGDGKLGLSLALEKHPDIILADLKLPGMGGMEMIEAIRKDSWGKSAEIVIFTNASDAQSLEEAMRHETYFYIVKGDSTMEQVVEKITARVKSRPKQS